MTMKIWLQNRLCSTCSFVVPHRVRIWPYETDRLICTACLAETECEYDFSKGGR